MYACAYLYVSACDLSSLLVGPSTHLRMSKANEESLQCKNGCMYVCCGFDVLGAGVRMSLTNVSECQAKREHAAIVTTHVLDVFERFLVADGWKRLLWGSVYLAVDY